MKSEYLQIRVDNKKEIEQHVKEKTVFENVSDYIRNLIREDMKKASKNKGK